MTRIEWSYIISTGHEYGATGQDSKQSGFTGGSAISVGDVKGMKSTTGSLQYTH